MAEGEKKDMFDRLIEMKILESLEGNRGSQGGSGFDMKELVYLMTIREVMKPQSQGIDPNMLLILAMMKDRGGEDKGAWEVVKTIMELQAQNKDDRTLTLLERLLLEKKNEEENAKVAALEAKLDALAQYMMQHGVEKTAEAYNLTIDQAMQLKEQLERLGLIAPKSQQEQEFIKWEKAHEATVDLKKTEMETGKEILENTLDRVDKKLDMLIQLMIEEKKTDLEIKKAQLGAKQALTAPSWERPTTQESGDEGVSWEQVDRLIEKAEKGTEGEGTPEYIPKGFDEEA